MIHSIKEIIQATESVIAVFTHGEHLNILADGSGSSGIWVTDPNHDYHTVVIYLRTNQGMSEFYKGKFMGFRSSGVKSKRGIERQYILFTELKHLGNTKSNWIEFCGGSQNPVKLFSPDV
jgi:hypothetical protein